ncbi:MAG: choice-of-anchor F family protein [Myxococcota bacterium]
MSAQDPVPNTYTDADVPLLDSWSDVNTRTVDAESPDGRTYIYPDAATRDADADGDGTGSVAFIAWELDDGSGRAPGLQVVTDDFAFPVQNCIMASGERESSDFPGTILPKNCSDEVGSSKRFFLEVTEADTPVDLVFDTGVGTLRYKGVRDPSEDGGDDFEEFRDTYGVGRIYRMIGKFLNETGVRVAGVRVEIGTGVGEDFEPLDLENDGVTFELRELVEREFFVGETGAGPREVWNPERFGHFSPKLFHDGVGRFDPGFFDVRRAGFFNPQSVSEEDDHAQFIFSGSTLNDDTGIYGSLTQNYFSMAESQGQGTDLTSGIFGYLLAGELSPYVIDRHDDGDPLTESDTTMAWWDGTTWRYGVDESFAEVPESQLEQWASLLLGLDVDNPGSGPERYDSALADDLSGMNMDLYLRIQDMILGEDGQPRHDSITMRLTAVSVDSLDIGDAAGTGELPWVQPGNEAPPLASYMPDTGMPVAINDYANTLRNESVEIDVLANDLLDGSAVPNSGETTVVIGDAPANGTASVDPTTNVVTYTPDTAYAGPDSFTYTIEYDDGTDVVTSNAATVNLTVIAPPDPDVPVAANDSASTVEDEPITIDVLANDTVAGAPIVDGPNVSVEVLDNPIIGTVEVNDDNTITYTADSDANFSFVERFTYTVTVDGAESNAALVTVRAESKELIAPVANDDTAETTGTEPVVIDILANDTYDDMEIPDSGTVAIVDQPSNGEVVLNDDRTISYTASEGFEGIDTLTYEVTALGVTSDTATVSITVTAEEEEEEEPDPDPGEGDEGCGCSATSNSVPPFAALFFALGLIGLRLGGRHNRR